MGACRSKEAPSAPPQPSSYVGRAGESGGSSPRRVLFKDQDGPEESSTKPAPAYSARSHTESTTEGASEDSSVDVVDSEEQDRVKHHAFELRKQKTARGRGLSSPEEYNSRDAVKQQAQRRATINLEEALKAQTTLGTTKVEPAGGCSIVDVFAAIGICPAPKLTYYKSSLDEDGNGSSDFDRARRHPR